MLQCFIFEYIRNENAFLWNHLKLIRSVDCEFRQDPDAGDKSDSLDPEQRSGCLDKKRYESMVVAGNYTERSEFIFSGKPKEILIYTEILENERKNFPFSEKPRKESIL
jgi:hypothetical protein